MKKLLLSALLFTALSPLVSTARAGHTESYVRYYDHCGRPVYGYVHVDDYPRHRDCDRDYDRPSRSYGYESCAPRVRYYESRPRVSFSFGF